MSTKVALVIDFAPMWPAPPAMSHGVMSLRLTEPIGATPLTERSLAPDLARGVLQPANGR